MLEGLAAWLLNTYVGEYVENLNTDQLSIGLLQGAVELENLPLKKDALAYLDLPIEVKTGFIGRIKLRIPYQRLKSEPTEISIDKVYLVAGPPKNKKYDEDAEETREQQQKKAQLDALENIWQSERQQQQDTSSGSSWWSSFGGVASNIVENVQLKLTNIHIRYEDDVTVPSSPFACGIVIKSLSAQSTDASWIPQFVGKDKADMMHKLLDLQGFSVYFDNDAALLGSLTMHDLATALERPFAPAASTGLFKDHEYILEPVSAQAKMKRNTSILPLRSSTNPRITLDIELQRIPVALGEDQYRSLIVWMKEFDRYDRGKRYRKWRPEVPVKNNAAAWWMFSIQSNLHYIKERNRRRTKEFVLERAHDIVCYVNNYVRFLTDSYLSYDRQTQKELLEEELSFEEVKILRELAVDIVKKNGDWNEVSPKQSQTASSSTAPGNGAAQPGYFQRWFPGWAGYGKQDTPDGAGSTSPGSKLDKPSRALDSAKIEEVESKIVQEIRDAIEDSVENNTLLKRDTVFAKLNLTLQSGSFKLLAENSKTDSKGSAAEKRTIIELECSRINITFISRPRSSSMLFGIAVGGLRLTDKITDGSLFPVLISPQSKERGQLLPHVRSAPAFGRTPSSPVMYFQPEGPFSVSESSNETLFELTCEVKPPGVKADYRFSMKTKPLDIIYNATSMQRVSEFFKTEMDEDKLNELQITAAAMNRYEELKNQTKVELRQTLDQFLEGQEITAKRIVVDLDIAAPMIIIPEDFLDTNSILVVFDFGRLLFKNKSSLPSQPSSSSLSEDTDDTFQTPCSTPPREDGDPTSHGESSMKPTLSDVLKEGVAESDLYDRLYDRYMFDLSDLQVMVGRVRENWRHAHYKGTSHLHIVDKFTVSVQYDRRLLSTTDVQYPSSKLAGTLPSLLLHVNEQKIMALTKCLKPLNGSKTKTTASQTTMKSEQADRSLYFTSRDRHLSGTNLTSTMDKKSEERPVDNSQLVVMQFAINKMSLEIQSKGRCAAELQVSGVKATCTKRPHNLSVSMSVHSLLIADALQTYGTDYELLVASHKNLSLDARSGSIRGSEPGSPNSPYSVRSPISPRSPSSPRSLHSPSEAMLNSSTGMMTSLQAGVTTAFSSLMGSATGKLNSPFASPVQEPTSPRSPEGFKPFINLPDEEALISVEYELIEPTTKGDETLQIATIQFNSLEVIANQATLMELISFFQRVSPSVKPDSKPSTPEEKEEDTHSVTKTSNVRTEINADFHRLNVLLMRVDLTTKPHEPRAIKVATATLVDAKIQCTVGETFHVDGSLGGLQVTDLTQEGATYQKIFSVGCDPSGDLSHSFLGQPHPGMFKTALSESMFMSIADSETKAFTFSVSKHRESTMSPQIFYSTTSLANQSLAEDDGNEVVTVGLQVASLCYTHSPTFMYDLELCFDEFKDFSKGVASAVSHAAVEMASKIVSKRTGDMLGTQVFGSNMSLYDSPKKKRDVAFNLSSENILLENDESEVTPKSDNGAETKFRLDVSCQTPVILIPKTSTSTQVLVAHLGRIRVQNTEQDEEDVLTPESEVQCPAMRGDKMNIEIRDMNLYAVDLAKYGSKNPSADVSISQAQFDLYSGKDMGVPIIHDTALEVKVQWIEPGLINDENDLTLDDDLRPKRKSENKEVVPTIMEISGRVITPLKIVLSKQTYEQILKTKDNLTYTEPLFNSSQSMDIHIDEKALLHRRTTIMHAVNELENTTVTKANFELPTVTIELQGDFGEDTETGLVELMLNDFQVNLEKGNKFETTMQVSLQSLSMEDLLQDPNSKHRRIMYSSTQPSTNYSSEDVQPTKSFLSTSCPDSKLLRPTPQLPSSLPTSLKWSNVFDARPRASSSGTHRAGPDKQPRSSMYPSTPPPTPARSRSSDNMDEKYTHSPLIHISALFVDKNCPGKRSRKAKRFLDVDFKCLDTTINLQTWVVLLDFLGMGAKVHDMENLKRRNTLATPAVENTEEANTELKLKVESFSIILNKGMYELTKATLSKLDAHVHLEDGDIGLKGNIGSVSIVDSSPHGRMYREKFVTAGDQALSFDIFKYGLPDPDLRREFDIKIKIRMSAVWYTHTHRFMQETIAFIQHFNQLQDILGQMRAASTGIKVKESASINARMLLDIEAGAPVILIPHSSRSTDILVANLGTLSVHNIFLFDGKEGTIRAKKESDMTLSSSASHERSSAGEKTASDPMMQSVYGDLDLDSRQESFVPSSHNKKMVSFTVEDGNMAQLSPRRVGEFRSSQFPNPSIVLSNISNVRLDTSRSANSEIEQKRHVCLLDVWEVKLMDMDLYSAERVAVDSEPLKQDMVFSEFYVRRQDIPLLKQKCMLSLQVERNLENDISHAVPDMSVMGELSSVHCSLDVDQYKLIRGVLSHNFGEKLEEFRRPMMSHLQDPKIQTVLSGDVWKVISIEIFLNNVTVELLTSHERAGNAEESLAQLDFQKSRLSFESFSDQSKDIDLVSLAILMTDTRYRDLPVNQRPNVFTSILQPSKVRQSDSTFSNDNLQLELHFRETREITRFTVVLNDMRLMGVFDWLLPVQMFISSNAIDPFTSDVTPSQSAEDILDDSIAYWTPSEPKPSATNKDVVVVGEGILTRLRYDPQPQKNKFELNVNIKDTELVVVENANDKDTNAVILKSTAVLCFRPNSQDRPLSASLQSLEIFSCSLMSEDETALSIVDPMTVTVELSGPAGRPGLSNAVAKYQAPPFIEISFSTMNVRLSYSDLKLFLAISESLPQQAQKARSQNLPRNASSNQVVTHKETTDYSIRKLQDLGFAEGDCKRALELCDGHIDDAALWLTQNTSPIQMQKPVVVEAEAKEGLEFSGIELKAECICLCLIDDCKNIDIPLAEFTLYGCKVLQTMMAPNKGEAMFQLSSYYYNRGLSGWEPFLEPWQCKLNWKRECQSGSVPELQMDVAGDGVLNVNLTSAFLDQYDKTKKTWTDDYFKLNTSTKDRFSSSNALSGDTNISDIVCRRRDPFIPYSLRNETGCKLSFATVVSTAESRATNKTCPKLSAGMETEWKMVLPGDEMPFVFEEKDKMRHKNTHELRTHQLVVKVNGWEKVSPISVDKVGIYFRDTQPEKKTSTQIFSTLASARIVFSVKLKDNARKVITVRSALMIDNELNEQVEVKLENTEVTEKATCMALDAHCSMPVPLQYVGCRIWVRPTNWSVGFCDKPIHWQNVVKSKEVRGSLRHCGTVGGERCSYRFCVSVVKENFPSEVSTKKTSGTVAPDQASLHVRAGHVLTLTPPVVIVNLLPIEMNFYLKDTDISGRIKPSKEAALFSADLRQVLELGVSIENLPTCKELVIPPGTTDYLAFINLYDHKERLLQLNVRIVGRKGGALKLFVSAPYWLVNKSGLPLIFRQDSTKFDAAGQGEEHELARSLVPLLFSYSDREAASLGCMRLGKSVHGRGTVAKWCNRFSMESGIGTRKLKVEPGNNRPDWVYTIGIDVRQGRGHYQDTKIVTFSPRFQLENRTSHKLAFAQRHVVLEKGAENPEAHFTALPDSSQAFHWPRQDLDQMLCVRMMDVPHCRWSGGFQIDKIDSFHINMRGENMFPLFLRLETVLQGATFFVVFTDADQMPPPFRIDNYSEVQIRYYQTEICDEKMKTFIKPRSSMPYSWDEPTLKPHISCSVQGGTSSTYNMNKIGDGAQLCYENFIYIAFTKTTRRDVTSLTSDLRHRDSELESRDLVLDVISPGNDVVLKKKEPGKRSQLWRMTSHGMLQHEGSSVPRDLRKPSQMESTTLVLDVADMALQPDLPSRLILRKPDERRKSIQTWHFTEDGRLSCSLQGFYVQAQGGLFDGRPAVLAYQHAKDMTVEIPPEMCVGRSRYRPGSGLLSVKVIPDGPTRVLQIVDIKQRQLLQRLPKPNLADWYSFEESKQPQEQDAQTTEEAGVKSNIKVNVRLGGGIGISLINRVPEELIYISLKDIDLKYQATEESQVVDGYIKNIQIDNQLLGTNRCDVLYVTPSKTNPGEPALSILAHKIPSKGINADIFKILQINIRKFSLVIEEKLLWKLIQYVGFAQQDPEIENLDGIEYESQRALTAATSVRARRYYFGAIRLNTSRITLSVLKSPHLQPDLEAVKKQVGIRLISFEDTKVELDPFIQMHPFETSAFLLDLILLHYKEELKSQAAKILGSVDFLGSPLGLFNDVTEGISELIKDGNVGGLLKNVTHGVSNSAAKMTGGIADGIAGVILDQKHAREREQIRTQHGQSSADYMVAGMRGLGHGIVGGMTSVVQQTYEGVAKKGVEGFFSGFGKGVVDTFTKPIAGVLDFASGTAGFLRDSSKRSTRYVPERVRKPRCCFGPSGVLPEYSEHHALAQEFLYELNENDYIEKFISIEQLRFGRESGLRALITSRQVYFLREDAAVAENIMLSVAYVDLYHCRYIEGDKKYYVELLIKQDSRSEEKRRKPQIRCDSLEMAQQVVQQILYAKSLYDESKQTLEDEESV